mmetsp:Transcript_23403/g.50544  ORF Transcript_23403/g.50544 Transcript_23403/m.50544 type:complete len:330 (+) Transcript_23403:489-1478(+)
MEGGLLRDVFTHKLITKDHWDDLMSKFAHTREELDFDLYVKEGDAPIEPAYDPKCDLITNGCEPVAIISADKLREYDDGPAETAAIAEALMNDARMGKYVIAQEAWDCIWEELIQHKKGPITIAVRPGYEHLYEEYNFSFDMLFEMIDELNRLISKYSSDEWKTKPTAIRLVEILTEHRASVEKELEEIHTGKRKLTIKDFLGPDQRETQRKLKQPQDDETEMTVVDAATESKRKIRMRYFTELEQKLHREKRSEMKQLAEMREEAAKSSGETSNNIDLLQALSDALVQVRILKDAGTIDQETALRLVKRIRTVTMDAKVGLMKVPEEK